MEDIKATDQDEAPTPARADGAVIADVPVVEAKAITTPPRGESGYARRVRLLAAAGTIAAGSIGTMGSYSDDEPYEIYGFGD